MSELVHSRKSGYARGWAGKPYHVAEVRAREVGVRSANGIRWFVRPGCLSSNCRRVAHEYEGKLAEHSNVWQSATGARREATTACVRLSIDPLAELELPGGAIQEAIQATCRQCKAVL